jgi:hypothetical protein
MIDPMLIHQLGVGTDLAQPRRGARRLSGRRCEWSRAVCAIIRQVLPRMTFSSASWINASVSVSTLEVASSMTRISGWKTNTRARDKSWRCPPEKLLPRSRTEA